MDEGVGEQLAGLLQVVAVLDGVGQDARQQTHVLALCFHVARFQQGQVREDEGDDSLLGLGLPLADHTCKDTTEEQKISLRLSTPSCRANVVAPIRHIDTIWNYILLKKKKIFFFFTQHRSQRKTYTRL